MLITALSHLYFSVGVVCSGIHQVQNKELNRLTEMLTFQCGEVQKHMDRYLKDQRTI